MTYNLEINGFKTDCSVLDNEVNFNTSVKDNVSTVTVNIVDIIGVEDLTKPVSPKPNTTTVSTIALHYIDKTKNPKWTKGTYRFTGAQDICSAFISDIKRKLESVRERPRRLLAIVNPIGGKKNGRSVFNEIVNPLFKLACITAEVIYTERANHITDIINEHDLTMIDGIVLLGGDGSFQECVTALLRRTHDEAGIDVNNQEVKLPPINIPIGLIPTGSGNLVANHYYRSLDYGTAVLHVIRGYRFKKNLGGAYCDGKLVGFFALNIGYGLFSDMVLGTDSNRWLGTARYIVGAIKYFLLKTPRRFDAEVIIYNGAQEENPSKERNTGENLERRGDNSEENQEQLNVENETATVAKPPADINTEKYQTVNETLINIILWMLDITDDDFRVIQSDREDRCTLSFFKPCGRLENLTFMKNLVKQKPETFLQDHILNYRITRLKLKTKNDSNAENDFLNRHFELDGEIFEIPKAEFEVRLHFDACRLFCSR